MRRIINKQLDLAEFVISVQPTIVYLPEGSHVTVNCPLRRLTILLAPGSPETQAVLVISEHVKHLLHDVEVWTRKVRFAADAPTGGVIEGEVSQ